MNHTVANLDISLGDFGAVGGTSECHGTALDTNSERGSTRQERCQILAILQLTAGEGLAGDDVVGQHLRGMVGRAV